MKETFYIYHIPSVKIGVSKNPSLRVKRQGYDSFEVLETHTDIIEVSHREIELQKQYGYTKDCIPYYIFVNGRNQKLGAATGAGGKAAMAGLHGQRIRSMGGKVGGKKRAEQMTFEERSQAGKRGGKSASQNLETFMGGYVTCKHCSKTMNVGNHDRWHGNKCKNKKGVI
jgi:hypothetical protein